MNIVHASDNHGLLVPLDSSADAVIHTGDFCPSFSRGIRAIEVPRQDEWLFVKRDDINRYFGERPVFIVEGNHDYINLGAALRGIGVNAHSLHYDGPATFRDHRIIGFPYVPAFTREWNRELEAAQMEDAVAELQRELEAAPTSILALHSPIYGVLDRNHRGDRCGNQPMREMLVNLTHKPRVVLCGHIHESNSLLCNWKGMIVSNAATGQRNIRL